jgi:hypothetical protein
MLDLQRQRSGYQFKESVFFARGVLIAHIIVGASVAVALMFHEVFFVALVATGWYLLSLLLIAGMAWRHQICRILLALWFIVGAAAAIVYLVWFLPTGEAPSLDAHARLSLRIMPLWLSTVALGYGIGGALLLGSKRMERATMRGFALWEAPRV